MKLDVQCGKGALRFPKEQIELAAAVGARANAATGALHFFEASKAAVSTVTAPATTDLHMAIMRGRIIQSSGPYGRRHRGRRTFASGEAITIQRTRYLLA